MFESHVLACALESSKDLRVNRSLPHMSSVRIEESFETFQSETEVILKVAGQRMPLPPAETPL